MARGNTASSTGSAISASCKSLTWKPKPPRTSLLRACPVWVHFHARLVFIVTDRIVLLRVWPTTPSRRPFDPPSPGYFLLSGIRISFSSLPSLVFSSRARRSARFGQRPELRLGSWPPRNHPEIVRQHVPRHLAFLVRMPLAQ